MCLLHGSRWHGFLMVIACFTLAQLPAQAAPPELRDGLRVLFLGDSNTYAGQYVTLVEATVRERLPGRTVHWLNLGLPSETVSGLSEPDHPYPRPTLHERLDRVLRETRPDFVFACYGMNDGIYFPFSRERFEAYQQGIRLLEKKVQALDVPLVLLTPPPFDPLPQQKSGKLRPAGEDKYAWFAIYEDYDSVLKQYSQWLLTQKKHVHDVIDIRGPMESFMLEQRKQLPAYTMSGDGVHFGDDGHRIIADQLLQYLGIPGRVTEHRELVDLVTQRQVLLRDAWVTHCGHKRPGTKAGKPLDEAQAEARSLDQRIKKVLAASNRSEGKSD